MAMFRKAWKYAPLGLAAALLSASFVGLIGMILLQEREDALDRARLHLANLRSTAEIGLSGILRSFDLSLEAAISGLAKPDLFTYPAEIQHAVLFDNSSMAPQFGSIIIFNANGTVIADSRRTTSLPDSASERDFFNVHKGPYDIGLYVTKPFVSRYSGETIITLSRRIPAVDGSFAGVVAGSIRLDYIQHLLNGLDLGTRGVAALLREDGMLLARAPTSEALIGRDMHQSDLFDHVSSEQRGVFEARSSVDNEERLFAYSRLGAMPLVLAISTSKAEILAAWKSRASIIVLVVVLLLMFATIVLWRFSSEMDRRLNAELALKKAARQLERLSLTDALTGLANRRSFDMTMEREWARHRRDQTAFALLLIDVDHFKAYNDRYGHQAGDTTLALVARIIEAETRRPVDLAARYGGEEFVLILPDTSRRGAITVAERIRASLADHTVGHDASPRGLLTLSIGIACVAEDTPGVADSRDLVGRADAALYVAKNSGRDRIGVDETRHDLAA